jgi:hypothetical protein
VANALPGVAHDCGSKNFVFAEVSSSQLICDIRRSCGRQHRAPAMLPCRFLAHRVISLPRGNSVAFGLKRTLGRILLVHGLVPGPLGAHAFFVDFGDGLTPSARTCRNFFRSLLSICRRGGFIGDHATSRGFADVANQSHHSKRHCILRLEPQPDRLKGDSKPWVQHVTAPMRLGQMG